MALKVIWSIEAQANLEKIIHYLEENWTERELMKFAKSLEKQITLITENPLLYKKSERLNGTHECLISEQNSLFYIHDKSTLFIVAIWDNRQDPENLIL